MSPKQLLVRAVRNGALLAGLAGCGEETVPVAELGPLPADLDRGCEGQGGGGGERCREVSCVPAEDDACAADPGMLGSGCGQPVVSGPYAVAPDDPEHALARRAGPCCYVVDPGFVCEGRPLVIEDAVRMASLVARADWC